MVGLKHSRESLALRMIAGSNSTMVGLKPGEKGLEFIAKECSNSTMVGLKLFGYTFFIYRKHVFKFHYGRIKTEEGTR